LGSWDLPRFDPYSCLAHMWIVQGQHHLRDL
jgi:hypothetical protein